MKSFDVIVIGGGPAGVTAALRARELGATVALVERGQLGGTCTNDGCVPTRVLAKAARLLRDTEHFNDYGLIGERPTLDFPQLLVHTQDIVYQMHEKKQLIEHLGDTGVTLYINEGAAAFVDEHTITVGSDTKASKLQAERFILCVGGHARRLDFPGAELALTHSDVWRLKSLPRSIAIIGAAATGCQLASVFNAFGSHVTLLELAPRILPGEDEAVSQVMDAAFRSRGIDVRTKLTKLESIEQQANGLRVHYGANGPQSLDVEAVVLAVGWPGNIESLKLDVANVKTERGYVVVDDALRTSTSHIFAAGDITGRMMLVQSATYDARIAAENALKGEAQQYQHRIVPHGGFTDPEYGSVGLTEAKARENEDVLVAVVPFADIDRAVIDRRTEGMCKLIVSKESHQLLGAHVVGEQALEIIHLVAAGMSTNMTLEQLAELEIAYPTYVASVGVAARRLIREAGIVELAPQWRTLSKRVTVEWERREL